MVAEGGQIKELGDAEKEYAIKTVQKQYMSQTLRTLLTSYCDYDINEWAELSAEFNNFATTSD